jgi:hypothetical protein
MRCKPNQRCMIIGGLAENFGITVTTVAMTGAWPGWTFELASRAVRFNLQPPVFYFASNECTWATPVLKDKELMPIDDLDEPTTTEQTSAIDLGVPA